MAPFMYGEQRVRISHTSDIPYEMRPAGRHADLIQKILDQVPPWEDGENPIEEMHFRRTPVRPMAVEVDSETEITWGVHRGHKARVPGISPFVDLWVEKELMGYITIELEGSPGSPLLTRAYGGRYTPPLPWMTSAKDADGGREACLKYWQSHAYLSWDLLMIKKGTSTLEAPKWFGSPVSS